MSKMISVIMDDLAAKLELAAPTVNSLNHAIDAAGAGVDIRVVGTADIDDAFIDAPGPVVLGPGAPYDRPDLAEEVIRSAREQGLPLVAT